VIKKKDTNQEYHSHDSISASGLKTIFKKSVYHFVNREKYVSTSAMNFGSAVHSLLLEYEKKEVFCLPKNLNLRTKKDREYKKHILSENKDKIIVSHEEKESLNKIIENVTNNKLANKLISTLDEIENSYYGTFDNVPVRIRPDGIKKNRYIIDIKTCQDASPIAFRNSIFNYAYHLQACFYSEMLGFDPSAFRFIAIENKYPYDVAVYSLSDNLIEKGKQAWRLAFKSWRQYIINNKIQGFHWQDINEDGSHIL
tara:strand:+ start:11959 stop:12723 length:765 start_codon:yes stop_codon:yes gene_type:complete